jgi:molybdopterin biosynthesis enzyme MoaB
VTPEATRRVIEREVPGLAEAMRAGCSVSFPHAWLSRAVAGLKGKTLIVNLPGSERGAVENLAVILPLLTHALEVVSGGSLHPVG